MSKIDWLVLLRLATEFRAAIEATSRSSLPEAMENFPRGSCGDATLLLAKYLEENGCGSFDYVLGEKEERSHAWLQKDGIVVDITCDQFPDMQSAVFVKSPTRWHASFNGEVKHVANFETYDERTKSMLHWAYENILTTIKGSHQETQQAIPADRGERRRSR
jgi:hypothetical protein